MKIDLILGESDLGTHVNGSEFGPSKIIENISPYLINRIYCAKKSNIVKSLDKNDLAKNLDGVNEVSKKMFDSVCSSLEDKAFPIILGGDHSVVIGSTLASQKHHQNLGIIWIDAHCDYNTFETTITGNLHGLPLAAICGYNCHKLTDFMEENFINPKNCVIVGARSIDKLEYVNIEKSGATLISDEEVKKIGIKEAMRKSFEIANNGTEGVHVSFDLDVINPLLAPGVSIPEKDGFSLQDVDETIAVIIENIKNIKSFDLVEFNPMRDIDDKTLRIAIRILNKIIEIKTSQI